MGENYFQIRRPIDSLRLGHRIREDEGDVSALAASLQRIGFIQPITITPNGAVISGGRRLRAARTLGYKTVDV
jgi:ParB family chromosome partitioning protein